MTDQELFRPEWVAFEKELGFRPQIAASTTEGIQKQDMQLGGALLERYASAFPPPDPSVVLAEHRTTSKVRIKTYTSSKTMPGSPALCYYHGGGFLVGDVDRDDNFVTRLAKDTGLVFASVEYRLAPKHVYPAGFNDCIDAAKWCIDNVNKVSCHHARFVSTGVLCRAG